MERVAFKLLIALSFCVFQSRISLGQIKALNGKTISAHDMDAFLQHQLDSLKIPSLSVAFINNGKIAYVRNLGYADLEKQIKADDKTLYEAASMSKPVFAYFVLKMVDKGIIALDTPLYKYYPYPDIDYDERYKLFTARMVLCHSTGLPNWHEWEPPDSSLHVPKGAQYIRFTPGTGFYYSGEGYQYLVNVITHLLHTDIVQLGNIVHKDVCEPLGMKNAYFSWNDYVRDHRATGYRQDHGNGINKPGELKKFEEFSAAGGLRTNAVDLAHFLIALVNEKGLSKSSFEEMFRPQSTLIDPNWIEDNGKHWSLGLAMKDTKYGTRYFHSGNNGDYTGMFVMYRKQKSGFVLLSNCNRSWEVFKSLEPFFAEGKKSR